MQVEASREQPRLDNLALVSTFPADYLPYANRSKRPETPSCTCYWKYKRKALWLCKCCTPSSAATVIAIVFTVLAFLTALGISVYFGVLTTLYTSPVFHIFGEMWVSAGEQFETSLLDASSERFAFKALNYESRLRSTFLRSMFQHVLHDVKVYAFREPNLVVFFRLHLDRRKAAELQGITHLARTVLLQEIQNGDVFQDLVIPPESVIFTELACPGSCVTTTTSLPESNVTENITIFTSLPDMLSNSSAKEEGKTSVGLAKVLPSSLLPSEGEQNENFLGYQPQNDSAVLREGLDLEKTRNDLSVCSESDFRCTNDECVPSQTRCDRRLDCTDQSDERNCSCAEALRALRQDKKICDGFYDCWDYSDELSCPWCSGPILCPGSKTCIQRSEMCDGVQNCPSGFDEASCMKLAKDDDDVTSHIYSKEGYLMIQRQGEWKKLCLDDNDVIERGKFDVERLGNTICSALTYKNLESIVVLPSKFRDNLYYDLIPPTKKSSVNFRPSGCKDGKVVRIKCRNLECGIKSASESSTKRIVGGNSVTRGTWPWQAALYREGQFQCGGVLISDSWLLSAGHCFYHTRSSHWKARLGLLRRGNEIPTPYEEVRRITYAALHPEYVDKGFINDIALLKLDQPTSFSDHIRPICLPTPSEHISKWEGKTCTVIGWGKLIEEGHAFPDTLQEVELPVISSEECRRRTVFLPIYQITDNMFCAGYENGGRDACLGDSGGPMMCQKADGHWVLMGITSNGDGCARAGRPGVYTKVTNYVSWIRSVLTSEELEEIKTNCSSTRCRLGRCLPRENVCDGVFDCWDGDDERGC
ncbi:atrial natriuretic peptide-converting enzyme-like isoform X2 [Centruroides vittatus]|uniref:atrial natriuretic peptide-converting enzyme-like isoform X2 n=1 Tax=Centruroides vittatus TaxID=120091 RepID=UPI003510B29B